MIKRIALLSVLCLTGCSSTTPYSSNNATLASPSAVTISNYKESVMATGNTAVIQSIDGRPAVYSVWGGPSTKSVTLTPGQHTLSIMNNIDKGVFSIPRSNIIEMQVDLKPGQHYQLQLSIDQNKSMNWLTNDQGDKASPVVTALYKPTV